MVQINVRVDEDVKRRAERVCQEIGISMSSAINVYLKKIARENKIPFELTADPFYSKENIDYLEKKYNDYKNGKLELIERDIIDEWNKKYKVGYSAWQEYLYWQKTSKVCLRRINQIIKDIKRSPF